MTVMVTKSVHYTQSAAVVVQIATHTRAEHGYWRRGRVVKAQCALVQTALFRLPREFQPPRRPRARAPLHCTVKCPRSVRWRMYS